MDYCDIEWFAWEMNRDRSVVFEIASKYCILDSLIDYDGYSISSKIMASGPITSWQIDGETVTDFILGAPKSLPMVTAAMKLKKHLPFGRKVMTNLDSTLKSRDITLPTKVHPVKTMVFFSSHVWM